MRVVAAMLLALSPTPALAAPTDWPVYVNVLHRYRVCYPPGVLLPQGETDNSAGQAFKSRDGAELDLYGYYPDDGFRLAGELAVSAATSVGSHGKITYRRVRGDWGVVSGSDGAGHLFYIKMLKRQDRIVKLELRYPASLAGKYDGIAARVVRCFAWTLL